MPTTHIQRLLGESMAAAITDYTFPSDLSSVTATFRRTPDFSLEAISDLQVSVTPGPVEVNWQQAPRGCDFVEVVMGISLAKRIASDEDIAELEDLNMAMIDAIRSNLLQLQGLPDSCDWINIALPVPYDREALTANNVFFSQIEVTYRVPMAKL